MGVQVILQLAHDAPERVKALVAVCGAFERPLDTFHNTDLGHQLLPLLTGAAFRFPAPLRRFWQRTVPTEMAWRLATATEINGQLIARDDFLPYLQHLARMDPLVFLAFLQAASDHSARTWLRSLAMPTLVFAGDRDHFTPKHLQEQMSLLVPDAEYCLMPGGSHAAPLELPELLELRLEAFSQQRSLGLFGQVS
jgi:pimeloyl-ACP methyl ester carboxylesterase